jgi:hypothetical protein
MKNGKGIFLATCVLTLALVALGCSGTSAGAPIVVTIPGRVATLPAVTLTLPGTTTTIPAQVVTIPSMVATNEPMPTDVDILPTRPATIVSHMAAVVDSLKGQCLQCHGVGGAYQYPMSPSWDGGAAGSNINPGVYLVQAGSIQDHTGRTADQCLICHAIVR